MTRTRDEQQKQVEAQMREIYSQTVVDNALDPKNMGNIAQADGFGRMVSDCDDTMEIWLKVRNDAIERATFSTNGCAATIACGNMTAAIVKGMHIAEALRVDQEKIVQSLGGLPEGNLHCALLAANTLKMAIHDYLALKKEPWKKLYRK